MRINKRHPLQGFTLIELAIAMSIVALLIGGMMIPLATRFDQQAYSDTQARLQKATDAIIGFAILNSRFPCPSIGVDGMELPATVIGTGNGCGSSANSDPDTAGANASWGDLPWGTLGISAPDNADAWNARIRYAVCTRLITTANFTRANLSSCGLSIFDSSNATILNISNNASFVVYSLGKNSAGATLIGTQLPVATVATTGASADELANLPTLATKSNAAVGGANTVYNSRNAFISRVRTETPTPPLTAPVYFDDLLVYASPNIVISKLTAAGIVLP